MKPPKEKHEQQRTGVWIPIAIWNKAESGEITFAELRLLMYVESLVGMKGVGCYASNQRLAEKIDRTSATWISASVAKLIEKGMLLVTGTVTINRLKYRLMETTWSRPILPIEMSLEEFTEDARTIIASLRKVQNIQVNILDLPGRYQKQTTGNRISTLMGKRKGRVMGTHKDNTTPNGVVRDTSRGVADATDSVVPSPNGAGKLKELTNAGSTEQRLAQLHYSILSKRHALKRPSTPADQTVKGWTQQYRTVLRHHDEASVRNWLRHMDAYWEDDDVKMPKAFSPNQLLDKAPNFQEAVKRARKLRGILPREDQSTVNGKPRSGYNLGDYE